MLTSTRKRFSTLVLSLAVVVILAGFFIGLVHLQRESLWADEAWTAWAVRSPYILNDLGRIQGDVHPPLYFLLLYGWVRLLGDSTFALRLFSALAGMTGLAATYATGARLFDRRTGLIASLLLTTSSLFVYYSREARMYTLLLALGALATYAYLRWRERPRWWNTTGYGLLLAALLYTHYAGALLVLAHVAHLLTAPPRRIRLARLIPYMLAFVLFLPWMPTFIAQMRANPNGPLALPIATDWAAVETLLQTLVSGYGGLVLIPLVIGSAVSPLRRYRLELLLLVLWLVITPLGLLALNAWVAPVYQVRYTIAILPAGALLVAYGLRWLGTAYRGHPASRWLAVAVLAEIVTAQLTMYVAFWPNKPPWDQVISAMVAARSDIEPALTDFAPYSPAAYYDRQLDVRRGIALDLSWRLHTAAESRGLAAVFDREPVVWAALPINTAKAWQILTALDSSRGISYRSSLVNMVFYRFDRNTTGDLRFRFGDTLRFDGGSDAAQQITIQPGGELCADLDLTALEAVDGRYSAGLHLIDITGQQMIAYADDGVGIAQAGDALTLSRCMTLPPDAPPGDYHLELVVYDWRTLERLPLIEDGGDDPVGWGDVLVLAAVEVRP